MPIDFFAEHNSYAAIFSLCDTNDVVVIVNIIRQMLNLILGQRNISCNGSIRLLVITEKQFEAIDILLGKLAQSDDSFQCEQLSIF